MLDRLNSEKRPTLLITCCLTIGLAAATPAWAEEIVVQNDSFVSGGPAIIVGDFVAGEHAGARLTSPINGAIVAVQIGWRSQFGGAPQSLERAIHIYSGTTFPTPGAELALLEGPVLSDGYVNEFRYLDEAQSVPLNVPVTSGQQFYVTLEFDNPTDIANGTASVFRDTSGCQASKNVLYAVPGGWLDFCLFLSGDLVIRAVIAGGGACCLTSGSCIEVGQSTDCTAQGGTYLGDGTDCDPNPCAQPTGACCHANGTCISALTQSQCSAFGDVWTVNQTCEQVACTPRGACCRAGGCLTLVPPANCTAIGGVYAGDGTDCAAQVCAAGACCLPDGSCIANFGFQCLTLGGVFQGPGTTCTPNPCPQPKGACCFDEFCIAEQLEAECLIAAGVWVGPFTTCGPPNPCEQQDPCEGIPLGDFAAPVGIDGLDIQYFVTALLAVSPTQDQICRGDFNDSGSLDAGDVNGMVDVLLGIP